MGSLNCDKSKLDNYLEYFSLKLLILLLITDLLLILLYIFCWLPSSSYVSIVLSKVVLHQELLWITEDQSYAEVFQYIKELWLVIILSFGYWQCQKILFLAWALLFCYLLLDDSLSIHEIAGSKISDIFQFPDIFQLRAVDLGEILFSVTVGTFFLIFISWAYYRSDSIARKKGKILTFFLLALAVSGILFDTIHVMVYDDRYLNLIFAVLEDGGEQIIMSCTLAFVYALNWQY